MTPPRLLTDPGSWTDRFTLLGQTEPSPQEYPIMIPQGHGLSLPQSPAPALTTPSPRELTQNYGVRLLSSNWPQNLPIAPERLRFFQGAALAGQIPTWRDSLRQFANSFYSVNLEMNHLPFNSGTTRRRFPEWGVRDQTTRPPNLIVQGETTVQARGELRPIQGMDESWITRVGVDFTPNLIYILPGIIPDLEIEDFTAVDPPHITYDWSRLNCRPYQSPVIAMDGGDLDYENPTQSGAPARTPHGSVRPAPPGNHDYWMFHFNPVEDTPIASLETLISDGRLFADSPDDRCETLLGLGALNLWAFLPTMGLQDPSHYEELGIPFNTFPRRLGDLIYLLWPLFSGEGADLRELAALLNPNGEYYAHHYMDAQGRPQRIPEGPEASYVPHYEAGPGRWLPIPRPGAELDRLNARRREHGLPNLTWRRRRRIPNDPRQVLRLDNQIRELNRREGLNLPLIPRRRGSVVDWLGLLLIQDQERFAAIPPAELPNAIFDARMRDAFMRLPLGHVQVNSETQFTIRYHLGRFMNRETGRAEPRFGLEVTFHPLDLGTTALSFSEGTRFRANSLQARSITVSFPDMAQLVRVLSQEGVNLGQRLTELNASIRLDGVHATGVRLGGDALELGFDDGHINSITFRANGERWRTQLRGIRSRNLSVSGNGISLNLNAEDNAHDIFLTQGRDGTVQGRMRLNRGLESGSLEHPILGTLAFTTIDPEREASGGNLTFEANPTDPESPFRMGWDLPYLGIWTSEGTLLRMEPGSSHIRNSRVQVGREGVELEGDLDLHASMPRGLGEGGIELFEARTSLDSRFEELRATGRFRIAFSREGLLLEGPDENNPLALGFRLADSRLQHRPPHIPDPIAQLPVREIIQTDIGIEQAELRAERIRTAEIRWLTDNGGVRPRLTRLESGPITLSDFQGQGSIWVHLLIWGFVRGFFPFLGSRPSGPAQTRSSQLPPQPDRAPLIAHLPEEVQRDLSRDDFLRIGGVHVDGTGDEEWRASLDDILLHIHEEGGRGQFGLIRVPQFTFGQRNGRILWHLDPHYLLNVFLNSPPRGGSFRFVRWPRENPGN